MWRALGLSEGANKTKVNKAFREVVTQYEQEFWEEQERGGRPPADIPVYDYLVSYLKREQQATYRYRVRWEDAVKFKRRMEEEPGPPLKPNTTGRPAVSFTSERK